MALQETPQDYTARILSFLEMNDPIDVLSSTPERLRGLITGRSREDLAWSPDSSRWSVVQIVAHLADSEIVGAWRFRSILAADGRPVALLRRVDPKLHANHGIHGERGIETIEHLVRLYAGHDLNHLSQVEKLVQDR